MRISLFTSQVSPALDGHEIRKVLQTLFTRAKSQADASASI